VVHSLLQLRGLFTNSPNNNVPYRVTIMSNHINGSPSEVRLKILLAIFVLFFAILAFRLLQKQIFEYDHYQALAKQQYTTTKELPPSRGKIYVKDGYNTSRYYPMALNQPTYQLLAVPKNIKNKAGVSDKVAPIINKDVDEFYNEINNNKPYIPPIAKKLTKNQAEKVERLELEGILLIPEEWRYYPEGKLLSHVLGYVNIDREGQYGLEGFWDEYLRGEPGTVVGEKGSWGDIIDVGIESEARDGDNLYLSIDRVIQYGIYERLKEAVTKYRAEKGTIIVAEPETGKIMAMASYPDFNPSKYSKTEDITRFNNPSIAEVYEPGSVFKVVTMASAIDSGKVQPETAERFGKCVEVGIETICTSTGKAYGTETMTQVLENSDNVGMVWVADQMEGKDFYNYIRDFGFGSYTEIDINTEVKGELLPLSNWREINKATMSFGQGIAVTPLQIVQAVSAIANGGKLMQPYIVEKRIIWDGEEEVTQPKVVRQVIAEDTAEKIKEMMVSVVENGFGRKAKVSGYAIAGKTVTAEVPVRGRGYSEDINIVSFAGFAPADNPAYTMLIKLDSPEGAPWSSDTVAPLFGEISEWLLHHLQIPPSS